MAWESQSACLLDVWGCGHQGTRCIFYVCVHRACACAYGCYMFLHVLVDSMLNGQ